MLGLQMWPRQYRLVVRGELGPRYAAAFEGMTISAHDDTITGGVIDGTHLYGLVTRMASLGVPASPPAATRLRHRVVYAATRWGVRTIATTCRRL